MIIQWNYCNGKIIELDKYDCDFRELNCYYTALLSNLYNEVIDYKMNCYGYIY